MALSLRFRLRRRTIGSDAPPADHLQGEMAASEPGNAFYYGYGAGVGDLASASHLLFRSDGTRLWHGHIGAADGSTVFKGDGSALTGVTAASVAWSDVTGTPTTLSGYGITDGVTTGDSRLTNAREWTASTVSQAEAEAGTATTRRAWTAQRVFQAIAAWWAASAAKTKLDGIATGATANSADATLLARANHTGTQAASTITGLATVATSGAYADLSGKPTLFDGTWSSLSGKPSTFAPSAHNHPASDISDSTAAGRALLTGADAAAQRTSLGLGTAATASVTTSATDTTAGRVLRVGDSATILSASPALRATVGGTADAITLTTGASLASLPTGLLLRWRAGSANTGAATINVDGLGAQACVTVTGAALPAGYIRADVDTVAIWDGTNWQVQREAEAGSNADGEYIRLADGFQECTRIVDLDAVVLATAMGSVFRNATNFGPYAFPVPFKDDNSVYFADVVVSGSDTGALRNNLIGARLKAGQFTKPLKWEGVRLISAATATGTAGEITRIALSATGRWY